ncbi:ABC transporter permease [Ornithinimicrobium sp. Y1847]|uniref:ABC transporter permease n=1 Tax=Ornithinimicrobium sp. Y1847 TaxID=3405419 RepID=UPI003B671AAF
MSDQHHASQSQGSDAGAEQAVAAAPPSQIGVEGGPTGPTHRGQDKPPVLHQILSGSALLSFLAIVLALLIGALLIAFADEATRSASGYFFSRPGDTFAAAWGAITDAYVAMFRGAIFDWRGSSMAAMLRPITESMVYSVPLILAGLGIAVGFRAGLFNIGAQGQIILGAIVASWLGFAFDLPPVIHLLVAVVGGAIGGAVWAGIPGVLKARFGANEVIVTIMLNYIAVYLISYVLKLPTFNPGRTGQRSPVVSSDAVYPLLLGSSFRLHLGFLVAIAAAAFVWWLMERSTIGFQLRAVGANPAAARTAGMSVGRITVITMLIAGALAGLAATAQVLGTERSLTAGVAATYGFDAITVALLGRSKPWGTFFAGLLFGALKAGGMFMQSVTSTPIDIILVLQAIIVLLIAAPPLVRSVFRLPDPTKPYRAPARRTKEAQA